jgi:type IX secretion system substrate protein
MKTTIKRTLFYTMMLGMFIQQSFAQYFFKSYDFAPFTTKTENGYSLEKTIGTPIVGSGWSIAGVSNTTPSAGDYDWLFIKTNSSGTVLCKTLLGYPLGDSAFSHVQLSSGRTVVAGFYRAMNGYEKASWSMLDTGCMHIGSKQIMDSLQHQYRGVTKDMADNFTLAGYINSFIPGMGYVNQILAAQYTPAGALIWAFKYMNTMPAVTERAYSICYQPLDGTYAITGATNRFTGPAGPFQAFILKITAAGIPIWFNIYAPMPGLNSEGRKIIAMPDGGFVITGSSNAFDAAANDYFVARVTPVGAPLWMNTYGSPEYREQSFSIVYQPTDMSLVFTGYRGIPGALDDIIISKITAMGAPVWTKVFPNVPGNDRGFDIETGLIPDGYGVTGQLFHTSSMTYDPFLLRTNTLGNVTATCQDSLMLQVRPCTYYQPDQKQPMPVNDIQIQPQVNYPVHIERVQCGFTTGINGNIGSMPDEFSLSQNYPNPFNPSTKISYSIKTSGFVRLCVYNSAGELVSQLVNNKQDQGNYEVTFNAANLSSGIYFYTLETEGFTATKKMVLIK